MLSKINVVLILTLTAQLPISERLCHLYRANREYRVNAVWPGSELPAAQLNVFILKFLKWTMDLPQKIEILNYKVHLLTFLQIGLC